MHDVINILHVCNIPLFRKDPMGTLSVLTKFTLWALLMGFKLSLP